MAGTLGELVVSITTDLSSFNAGLKQAEASMRNTTGKINEYTNKVGLTMTAAGAAITGAFVLMVKSAVDYSDQIYEVSQRTGVAVETLSRLKYVADQTESSFEAVAMGLKFLNKNIYDATNGNKEMNDNFKTLGITLKDEVTGQILKADEVLMKVADRFSTMSDNSAKTNLAIQIFGRSGEALVPILNLGSEGIKRLSDEADRLHITLTSQNAKDIDKFSDGMKTLKGAVGGLYLEITNQLLPSLISFVKQATEIVAKIREWTSEHPALTKAIAGLGLALLGLGTGVLIVNQLIKALQTLAIVASALKLADIGTVIGMGGLLVDVTVLAGLIGWMFPIVVAIGTALASWNIGRFIGESEDALKVLKLFIPALNLLPEKFKTIDDTLSGPDGLFTKMWEWLLKNEEKAKSILRTIAAISTFGISEAVGFGSRLATGSAPTETNVATPTTPIASTAATEAQKQLENTKNLIKAIEEHNNAVKSLNEQYVSGAISVEEYFTKSAQYHSDGITLRQQELEIMQQVMDFIDLKSDKELQELQIATEKIQMENDMAQQSISLEALSTDAMYQRLTVMDETLNKVREFYQVKAQLANQDLMDQQTTFSAATNLLQTMQSMHKTLWGSIFDFVNMGIKTFSSAFSTAISSIILGTKSAKEAFSDFCKAMITAVVEFVVQYAVQAALSIALGWLVSQVVDSIAGSMAAAWMPAAYLASVATLGGAVGLGTAALAGGVGTAGGILAGLKAVGTTMKAAATGGIVGLNGPEIVLTGENEPELITPLSKLPIGNSISIEINNPVIRSDEDIDSLTYEITRRLARGTSR